MAAAVRVMLPAMARAPGASEAPSWLHSPPLPLKPSCRIVSSDFLDRDVYLNIRCFYAAAGYRLLKEPQRRGDVDPDLLVVLRGDNGDAQRGFNGVVHLYDYVKEYRIDWPRRYPLARSIILISLEEPEGLSPDPRLRWLHAYLPVIPPLWSCSPARRRSQRPVHLSNYKRMPGDPFQEQLLALIRGGLVEVHGGRWEQLGVVAHPLSYRQANRLIAASSSCFGLMWPYQRGRTLSGRMWQAPIQGCFVLSEPGTDLLGCPGVIECSHFDAAAAALRFAPERCADLAHEASRFWNQRTAELAAGLALDPAARPGTGLIWRLRLLLLLWDLEFRLERLQALFAAWWQPPLAALRRRLAQLARSLGVHPRQLLERRRPPHQ